MKNIICLIFILLMIAVSASGQRSKEGKLLNRVDKLISERFQNIAPGCAILIAKNGKLIYEKAYGAANIELDVPITRESTFRIGSITKEFTAVAVLQLAEQGRLSLKDSLQKYISYFPYKGHLVTIENLLTHTSGILDFQTLDAGIPDVIRISLPPKRIIDSLKDRPLEFVPGTKYSYSNTNFFLLGMIIEKITGQSYKKYLEEYLFKPFALNNTHYDDPAKIVKGRTSGYRKEAGVYLNADYISMNWPYAAGALQSTVHDLYKWHEALFGYKIIKKESLEKATTPFVLANGLVSQYGYGFFLREWKGSKCIGHGGAIDGFRAMEMYFPDEDMYMAMLFNSEEESFLNLFEDVFSIMLDKESTPEYKDIKLEDKILASYTGIYTFDENPSMTLKVYKTDGRLYADLSDRSGTKMALLAQTERLFVLPDVRRVKTTIEFILENGKIIGLYWTQEGKHMAKRVE